MDGMTRAEVDKAESLDFALGGGPMRPRDAATLILVDRTGGENRVLIGRRHRSHTFMPGRFVFPGGRTDPADGRIPVAADLHPDEMARLVATTPKGSTTRARAIALSAIRETYEEAGMLIGRRADFTTTHEGWQGFAEASVYPALDSLRFIARAITPPGRTRRYDARFFAAWRDDVAVTLPEGGPTNELEEIMWLPIEDAKKAEIPSITRTILTELERRLADDPLLRPGGEVPCYRMVRNRFVRVVL